MDKQTLDYYAENAAAVAERYESIVNGLSAHFASAFPLGGKILDVGCGSGRDMAYLAARGWDVYGVDATQELVSLAQTLHTELEGRIVCDSVPGVGVPFGGAFDGVLCSAVLMHIPPASLLATVEFIKGCLKRGGSVLYSVPSKRLDVDSSENRDSAGRLFVSDSAERLQSHFEACGFSHIETWGNADSLGRNEVEWVSVLMRLGAD